MLESGASTRMPWLISSAYAAAMLAVAAPREWPVKSRQMSSVPSRPASSVMRTVSSSTISRAASEKPSCVISSMS